MKVVIYTAFALTAFASNSILCRLALRSGDIDPASFTTVRLVAGAVTLALLSTTLGKTKNALKSGQWISAFFLFAYAICFSFAYLGMTAGTGALILFGAVQITMITSAMISGNRLGTLELIGIAIAFAGLVYLVFPGLTAPPLLSSMLMAAAGSAWGVYTLRGRSSSDPIAETTGNFVRSVPMVVIAAIPFVSGLQISDRGIVLAVLSGAVASGVGYAVWYAALKYHTATSAGVLQLAVPIITGAGGLVLLSEAAELRLLTASVLVLGGILLAIATRKTTET